LARGNSSRYRRTAGELYAGFFERLARRLVPAFADKQDVRLSGAGVIIMIPPNGRLLSDQPPLIEGDAVEIEDE
jgi:hypothetical protein